MPAQGSRIRPKAALAGVAILALNATVLICAARAESRSNVPFERLLSLAAKSQSVGQADQAFALLRQASALADSTGAPGQRALVLASLSDAYLRVRRLDEALQNARQAADLARACAVPGIEATALNHLGNALTGQRRFTDALRAYRSGFERAERAREPSLAATLLTNQLHVHLAEAVSGNRLELLDSALAKTRALPHSTDRSARLVTLGYLAQRLAALPEAPSAVLLQRAFDSFTEARRQAEALGDARATSYARGHLGELYALEGRHGEAESLFRQALFAAAEADAPELAARWHWQSARSRTATRDFAGAKKAYRQALEHLVPIRSALVFGERGTPGYFHDTVGALYLELIGLLLRDSRSASSEIARQTSLKEVRGVLEAFRGAELRNYYLDECVSALQERQKSRELDPLIDPGTAVLYTISFPDRLVLLLNFSGGEMTQAEVAIGESELTETLAEFRKHLGSQGNPRRLMGTAMQLYEWLMRPIRPALDARRIRTLVVAPDQALRLLPFAALHDGRDFLIKHYAFVTSPGLTLTELAAGAPNRGRALLAGLTGEVQGFGQLPHVGDEVDAMAQLFDGKSLVDEAFLKNSVRRELERAPYGIVSFSTHAQISGDPRQSFLLTYDDRIDLNELERFVRTSQLRDQPLDLLVLSACETAEGDERAALGLAGVAVKAGARSVMASLWAVSDASTAELVPQFLKYLKEPGVTKAQALQRAQQRLLASTDYRQPYYWAPFVLIGNWH